MNGREWKPGDRAEAVVTTRGTDVRTVQRTDNSQYPWLVLDDLGGVVAHEVVRVLCRVEPVTIDPENREDVERLAALMSWAMTLHAEDVDRLQHTLREFTNPTPRIEEPTGLGAVVEDAEGNRFIRYGASLAPWIACASNSDMDPDRPYRYWSGIDAVRVLSEGVPS